MKKLLMFTLLVTMLSCGKDSIGEVKLIENPTDEFEISKVVYNSSVDGLKLPDGTTVKKISPSVIEFSYPKGIELWVRENGENFTKQYNEGSYTCTCSGQNGCTVIQAKGDYGCAHGECTGDCTGSHGDGIQPKEKDGNYVFVDKNKNLEPIMNNTDFNQLPYIPEMVLKHKDVQRILKDFAKEIYGNDYNSIISKIDKSNAKKSDFDNIVFIEMKMYGFKLVYGISVNDLKPALQKSNNFDRIYDEGFSCTCNSGESGCTEESSWGVKLCKGGDCTSCTMNN